MQFITNCELLLMLVGVLQSWIPFNYHVSHPFRSISWLIITELHITRKPLTYAAQTHTNETKGRFTMPVCSPSTMKRVGRRRGGPHVRRPSSVLPFNHNTLRCHTNRHCWLAQFRLCWTLARPHKTLLTQ